MRMILLIAPGMVVMLTYPGLREGYGRRVRWPPILLGNNGVLYGSIMKGTFICLAETRSHQGYYRGTRVTLVDKTPRR
jgi:hypothetical protein